MMKEREARRAMVINSDTLSILSGQPTLSLQGTRAPQSQNGVRTNGPKSQGVVKKNEDSAKTLISVSTLNMPRYVNISISKNNQNE